MAFIDVQQAQKDAANRIYRKIVISGFALGILGFIVFYVAAVKSEIPVEFYIGGLLLIYEAIIFGIAMSRKNDINIELAIAALAPYALTLVVGGMALAQA